MPVTMKSLGIDQLSVDERMSLMEELWNSMSADPEAFPLTNGQKADLQTRLEAHQDNPKVGTPWEEVKARLRSKP
jgi:putative addiction module component (TIGR02574 family)